MSATPSSMKAFRLHSYGGPETIQLDDVPTPTLGKSQVLVAVSAVGMNPFDWKIREGHVRDFVPLQLPTILGVDFVGTVVALGEETKRLAVGDRVMTMSTSLGALAEYIAVDESILARVPKEVNDISAATLPIPALTAWQALLAAGNVRPGMKVLIQGASGTVGAFAIQFAKAQDATVIATASAKNRAYVMELGADEFIDYQTEKFEDRARDIDLIIDCVLVGGSDNTTSRSWQVLKPNGAIVSVADPMVTRNVPEGLRAFFPNIEANSSVLEQIARQLADGKIKSKVAQVFARKDLVKAMEVNRAGGTTGRLIVDFKHI